MILKTTKDGQLRNTLVLTALDMGRLIYKMLLALLLILSQFYMSCKSFGSGFCNLYYGNESVLLINDIGISWIYVSVMKLCKLIR